MLPIGTKNSRFCFFVVFVTFVSFFVPVVRGFFEKGFFATSGNTLWDELYQKCGNRVSFYCVQNKLMNYINDTLDSDLRITEGIYFVKTNRNVNRVSDADSHFEYGNRTIEISSRSRAERALKTMTTVKDNDIGNSTESYQEPFDDEEEFTNFVHSVEKIENDLETTTSHENAEARSLNFISADNKTENQPPSDDNLVIKSLNKVTDILYNKTTDYLSSHDLRLDLPQIFFGGSKVVISPRGFDEDGGIMLKLNFNPVESGRSGSFAKYFHKMFKKKLLTSFLALLLIIKLIKIKLMYVLPVIIGVNAAKKLLLKTLLFLFPPLVHLFKLCTYYHAHASKLHFHHHKIKHHHHHIKVPVPVPVPVPSHKPYAHHDSHGLEYDGVPPVILDHEPPQVYEGPAYGNPEYYTRNDMTNQHADELASWGLKDFYASTESPGVLSAQAQAFSPYAEQNYKILAQASKPLVSIYKDPLKKNKGSNSVWKTKSSNHASIKNTLLVPYDSFYSPILQKIDSIFTQLGFNEEGCRERLICSMYKNPVRFSPHSNLLSTELSRDPSELEKPSQSNAAAIRFYRYVEAARDGQSQKECLALYPDCVVKTE